MIRNYCTSGRRVFQFLQTVQMQLYEYTQDWFIWFMIESWTCGWSTTVQPSRSEAIPHRGVENNCVFPEQASWVRKRLDLYRPRYYRITRHWSICNSSSVKMSYFNKYIPSVRMYVYIYIYILTQGVLDLRQHFVPTMQPHLIFLKNTM